MSDTVGMKPMEDSFRAEATRHYITHHAAAVAAASVEKMLFAADPEETVVLSGQLNKLRRSVLQSESSFLDSLWKMSDEDKLLTLFELFDKDGSETVSSIEMARAFARLDDKKSHKENLQTAAISIAAYDADDDGQMNLDEFREFLATLMDDLDCDFGALVHFLAFRVGFTNHGTTVLDEAVVALVQDSTETMSNSEKLHDAVMEVYVKEAHSEPPTTSSLSVIALMLLTLFIQNSSDYSRMVMLFQMLDLQGTGKVGLATVVCCLKEVAKFMDEIPRQALLMCQEDTSILFEYPEFSSLLLNVQSASCLSFHEIANIMTLALTVSSSSRDELTHVFQDNDITTLMSKQSVGGACSQASVDQARQQQRVARLFRLWDLDHSGFIDFAELALGLRKYHDSKQIDDTLKESVAAMTSFDENDDHMLDQKEFASFLVQFAGAANVPLHELIDFMLIEFVMKDNSDAECIEITDQAKALSSGSSRHGVGGVRGLWKSIKTAP